VVIEFGHNDGGAFRTESDNLRTPCAPGQTCKSKDGKTVKTFETYMTEAGKLFVEKGAKVVMSSATPNNLWEAKSGEEKCRQKTMHPYTPNKLPEYGRNAAKALGANGFYVDHGLYTAKAYEAKGCAAVNSYYPVDHTHTNNRGAQVVAETFAKAVVCAKIPLAEHIKKGGQGSC
jgi:rhamnogalacturonan acetylesterase